MTSKESGEKIKGSMALLVHSREVRTEATSRVRARPTAKTAGDFLLNLDHADVAFYEITVEGHSEIIDKGKNFAALLVETFRQIAGLSLLDTSTFTLGPALRRGRGDCEGLIDEMLIALVNVGTLVRRERSCSLCFGLVNLRFNGQQELLKLTRPDLPKLLIQRG